MREAQGSCETRDRGIYCGNRWCEYFGVHVFAKRWKKITLKLCRGIHTPLNPFFTISFEGGYDVGSLILFS